MVYDASGRPRWALQTLGKDIDGHYWSGSRNITEYRFFLEQMTLSGVTRTNLIAYERHTPSSGPSQFWWRY